MSSVSMSMAAPTDSAVAMTPPLPVILLQMVTTLKDRLPKGYPVKKVRVHARST